MFSIWMQTKNIICKALIDYADKNSTVIPVIAVKAYYLFEKKYFAITWTYHIMLNKNIALLLLIT